MSNALIVGGNSGVGLSVLQRLIDEYDRIYCVGKDVIDANGLDKEFADKIKGKVVSFKENFVNQEFDFLKEVGEIDTLVISVGFGRVAKFEDLTEAEINNLIKVDLLTVINIVKHYYEKINGDKDFYTAIMVSIAGRVASPLFSVYGTAKAGLKAFIENLNGELSASGRKNRILEVSPSALDGTCFRGGKTDLFKLSSLSSTIVEKMKNRETVFIPDYDEYLKSVTERYLNDPEKFALESYEYKIKNKRLEKDPQVVVGYLSGTFDLFHIGHLNLIRRAKRECDYLVVGIHNSGAWKGKETFIPFEERKAIVKAVKYVDDVIEAPDEDSDAWDIVHFNKLFVGSDYKGTDRFNRYEKIFKGIAQIIYFPYTQETSSTQLRKAIDKNNEE